MLDSQRDIALRIPNIGAMRDTETGPFHLPSEMAAENLLELDAKCR
jgi:hypothetical protein